MMVNMNGLSYGTWRNIQKAIEQFALIVLETIWGKYGHTIKRIPS